MHMNRMIFWIENEKKLNKKVTFAFLIPKRKPPYLLSHLGLHFCLIIHQFTAHKKYHNDNLINSYLIHNDDLIISYLIQNNNLINSYLIQKLAVRWSKIYS